MLKKINYLKKKKKRKHFLTLMRVNIKLKRTNKPVLLDFLHHSDASFLKNSFKFLTTKKGTGVSILIVKTINTCLHLFFLLFSITCGLTLDRFHFSLLKNNIHLLKN